MTKAPKKSAKPSKALIRKRIAEAGQRAAAEAEERRRAAAAAPALPKEVGGRQGLEPTRYGDWEKKGIATDF
jgi:hypothetical protein